jgi:hypothetical protein
MQTARQALDDVAGLVDLTALDRRVTAEGLADRLRPRLAPSMIKRRQMAGLSQRLVRLSSSACTAAVFSVAPSTTASGCLLPSLSMLTAATVSSLWIRGQSEKKHLCDSAYGAFCCVNSFSYPHCRCRRGRPAILGSLFLLGPQLLLLH